MSSVFFKYLFSTLTPQFSFIAKNKEDITQVLNDELSSLSFTADTELTSLSSNDSVPQTEPIVKREDNVEIKPDGKSSKIAVGLIVDGWGENGRVSFNSSFDAEVNDNGFRGTKAEYMRNYNRFYIQGLNGGKISNVPSQYADRISMSARKAAYNAGVADRNASLDAKYKARNEVVVKDGGLIRNHNTENISAEMSDVLERLGKMFGVTVEIQDKVIGDDGKEKNGVISNGEVKLSYDKMVKSGNIERVAEFIINHEIAHRVQELAPKEYQKFRDIALEVAIEGDKAKYINEYAKERNLTYDEAIDEIVCDMVGKESFATELALQQPKLAERIRNWIKDILDTLGLRKYNDFERLLRTWEIAKGNYREVNAKYERAYRKAVNEIHGNVESFRHEQGRDIWDMQPNEEGGNGSGNNQQVGSENLQDDTSGNNEHLRTSDKGKHLDEIKGFSDSSKQQYSEGDVLELLAENERLRNRNDILEKRAVYFKNQWYRSKPFTPRTEDISKLARKLGKGYKGNRSLTTELTEAYRLLNRYTAYVQNKNYDEKQVKVMWEEAMGKVEDIGMDIVKNTYIKNDVSTELYDDIRKHIRGVKIRLSEEFKNDFGGEFNNFRKRHIGRMTITTKGDGVPIDVVYDELNTMFGELFPDEITHPVDQLLYLDEFLDRTGVVFENPYNNDLDDAKKRLTE